VDARETENEATTTRIQSMTTTLRSFFSVFGLGALGMAGCSSSSPGSGSASLSGSVSNTTFSVASTLAVFDVANASETCTGQSDGGSQCTSSSSGQAVGVLLTNRSEATCSAVGHNLSLSNFDVVQLVVTNNNGNVATGTYAIAPPQGSPTRAEASFTTEDASCAQKINTTATGGSITLTQISGTNVSGSYSVTFGAEGSFQGTFDVPACATPDAGLAADGGTTTCQ
jgi:hypothetical protein